MHTPVTNVNIYITQFFRSGARGKESNCQCRGHERHGCDPWVRRPPGGRHCNPLPVFLAWRIPWTEEPGRLQIDTTEATSTHTMSQQYLIFVEVSRYTISILV